MRGVALSRKNLGAPLAFLAGFVVVVLVGKGVNGFLINGMKQVVPNGILLQGIVLGALNGLLAMGLVLIYRTNRIINFAQGELGAFSATLAGELVQRFHWPFYAAVVVGLLAAVGSSALVEIAVIRRFAKAPRLILTVATIGVFQIFGAIELAIPALLNKDTKLRVGFQTPLSFKFQFGKVFFTGDHLEVLVVTPLVILGLVWFLRNTGYGLAARAAAEDGDRARLLGIKVKRVSLIVWTIAGFLSALTAILQAPITGFQFGALGGFTLLLRALTAGVIARMESLPIAFGAAVLLTTAQQTLFFGTGRTGPDNGLLLLVIIVALLVQRRRLGRLEGGSSTWQAVQEVRPVPNELRRLPEIRVARWGLAAIGLGVLAVLPYVIPLSKASLVSVIMIYAVVGVSLVILTGWSGNVSLGQWALVGLGALIASKMATAAAPQDFFVILLVSGLAGALVAVVIGLPALRIKGLFLGVTTLAFALAAGGWFFSFKQLTSNAGIQRPLLFGSINISGERAFYFLCLVFLVLALLVARNLRKSRFGRVLIAMRDNEKNAQAYGVPFVQTKLVAFAVSGFMAALAGGLYAYHQQQIRADRFPADVSLLIFSMVVIGGMGSIGGAVLGAAFVRGTQYFLPAQWQLMVTGFGMLLLLWIFPGGLGQIMYALRDRYLKWVADRRGVLVPSLIADKRVVDDEILEHVEEEPPPILDDEPELVTT
ncbi:MAG: ABC transporter permease [Actinobacteria bacterium]|nr:ABC transporter permease [Actinomycetota bacterium]MBV9935524.1 ABC transporter permease [Actinomycetota bacterium]